MGLQISEVRYGRAAMVVLSALFVVCWSSGFVGAKLGGADAPVATVLMWRFVPLALILAPLAVRVGGLPGARALGWTVVVGLLSQTGYLTTVYWAISLGVNTGTTALIDGIQPLVAAAVVGPLLGVVVDARQWAGLALGLAGVVLVTVSDAVEATGVPWWAYPIPLAGMVALIAATVVQRRITARPPMLTGLAIQCCTSAAVFTVFAMVRGTVTPPAEPRFWLATGWLIVFATLGGYGLYWYLVDKLGVTQVNSLMFLMAPTTAVWVR
ncbi:DMT family transporter [Nocardia sp. N2S4-5]|uniref:DMT family transporter n=1 Tax=Nocardia sp. N2S4-5 TaxID=3351565 RepID=UPI0037D221D7